MRYGTFHRPKAIVAIFIFCAVLSAGARAPAQDRQPYIVGAGAGTVYDEENDFGWAFHLNALGHPGLLPWFQAGLELQYYGRPERLESDETYEVEDGTRQVRVHRQDAGYMAGLLLRFPFGFGGEAGRVDGARGKIAGSRQKWDIAPLCGGGLHFDASSQRESVRIETADETKTTHKNPRSKDEPEKLYVQVGIRWRFGFLEVTGGGRFIDDKEPQALLRLGFDAPW